MYFCVYSDLPKKRREALQFQAIFDLKATQNIQIHSFIEWGKKENNKLVVILITLFSKELPSSLVSNNEYTIDNNRRTYERVLSGVLVYYNTCLSNWICISPILTETKTYIHIFENKKK